MTATAPSKVDKSNAIDVILKAKKFEDIVGDDMRLGYKKLMSFVHPDLNKDPRANDAAAILTKLFKMFSEGLKFVDDSGEYQTNYYFVKYQGMQAVIDQGHRIHDVIRKNTTDVMRRYMWYEWVGQNQINFQSRSLPLSGLVLDQLHANWVVGRLIEYCMLLHNHTQHAHLGLTPEHVFLVPKTHGINVSGFYHATKLGQRMQTISGRYRDWYPASVLKNKIACQYADLHMVKRIGAYLLGDQSGVGTKLLRTHNKDFVNFLLSTHIDSAECFKEFRTMIDKNFESTFHHLNI